MAKNYGSMVDIIPAKGGMGPGGVGNVVPKGAKISEAEFQAALKEAESAGKVKQVPYKGRPQEKDASADVAKRTGIENIDRGKVTPKRMDPDFQEFKKGGMVKSKSSASKRADGCAVRGKTRA